MRRTADKIPFIAAAALTAVIAAATFVESQAGTPYAHQHIYGATWFYALWALTAATSIWLILRRKMWKRAVLFGLHLSFIVILAGALTTALTSEKGMLHLTAGTPQTSFIKGDNTIAELPFAVTLRSFNVEYYSGTTAPSDYVSRFVCKDRASGQETEGLVSMNNIFTLDGYRLYQSSYDEDMQGSWLTVNYDPYGTAITYTGYALLALFALLFLLTRAGHIRQLLRSDKLRTPLLPALLLTLGTLTCGAETPKVSTINIEKADILKSKQVMYNDRVAPLNTLATDFMYKITGKRTFHGLSPEQVMVSWMLAPEDWQHVKMIRIKDARIRKHLGVDGKLARFTDFFDADGNYRLNDLIAQERGTHSSLEKALKEADEQIGIIVMLTQGQLIVPLPEDGSVQRLSDTKVKAELLYNSYPVPRTLFIINLTLGLILLAMLIAKLLTPGEGKEPRGKARHCQTIYKWTVKAAPLALYAVTAALAVHYLLRWYVSGTVPLTNGYETMQFVALASLVIACLLHRRFTFAIPFGLLISGFTLLVCHLSMMNPQITPLMPVLQSPWLSGHVSVIMMSYALYAFMMMNGVTALLLIRKGGHQRQVATLTILSRLMLYPATFLLAIGIFLGAVWANVSWGSYWSWDPKEVWALVTMMVYSAAFHTESLAFMRKDKAFHIFIVLSFATILMTYFGVNYVLGGMHSYAGG